MRNNPEWTKADFRRAKKFPAGVRLKDLSRTERARILPKRKTRPQVTVSIRLSPSVAKHFKAKGPGWQSRISAALRKIATKAG
jgi:uncharacterized protein (DUF4415 family)